MKNKAGGGKSGVLKSNAPAKVVSVVHKAREVGVSSDDYAKRQKSEAKHVREFGF